MLTELLHYFETEMLCSRFLKPAASILSKQCFLKSLSTQSAAYEYFFDFLIRISFDMIVIGGGSGGISCAQQASANGAVLCEFLID